MGKIWDGLPVLGDGGTRTLAKAKEETAIGYGCLCVSIPHSSLLRKKKMFPSIFSSLFLVPAVFPFFFLFLKKMLSKFSLANNN